MKLKRKIIAVIAAAIPVFIFMTAFIFIKGGSAHNFSQTAKIQSTNITQISIRCDWGVSKTITSKNSIQKIISFLDNYKYEKTTREPSVGYLYYMQFKNGQKTAATMLIGPYKINDGDYKIVGKDMDLKTIEDLIGLYPPGCGNSK